MLTGHIEGTASGQDISSLRWGGSVVGDEAVEAQRAWPKAQRAWLKGVHSSLSISSH